MTSNLGVKKLQDFGTGIGFSSSNNEYIKEEIKRDILNNELKKFFAPEFLNRIDDVIVFNSLTNDDIKKIVKIEIEKLKIRLEELKYNISYDDTLVELISKAGYDEMYGARPLKRAIQDKVEDLISEEILKSTIVKDENYCLVVKDDLILIEKQKEKKSKRKKGD